jgi:hypothetical protein
MIDKETKTNELIELAKPQHVLSDGFLPRLKRVMAGVGDFSRTHPVQSAAGWSFTLISTSFMALVIVGRTDLLPDVINFLLRVVGA